MAIQSYSPKDPADTLDYEVNFGDWLVAGDAITGTPTLAVSPAGLTVVGNPVVVGSAVRFYVTGGVANMSYLISATVSTTAGRTAKRSVYLPVRPR